MASNTIGDLFTLTKGRKATNVYAEEVPGASRYIQIEDLRSSNEIKYATDPNGTHVVPEDICIAWDGANAGTVGYGLRGIIGSTISRLRPIDSSKVFTPYIARYLQSQFKLLNQAATGATIPHINRDKLMGLSPALPSYLDQRRITIILDKADVIRKKRRELTKLAEESIRSAFLQQLNDFCGKRVAIEDLLSATPNAIRTGPFGSQLLHSEFTDSGIPVLGIDNVVTNRFRWAERRYVSDGKYKELYRYRVFPGDVMVTIMGTTGRVCIAPESLPECISTKHLCTITPDRQRLLAEYLWASLLWDPAVRAQAAREGKGAIMEGWNMGIVKGLLIKLPSLAQQERFSVYVRKAESLRAKLLLAEAEAEQLFGSLAQRAFIGKI
jgi:type I restriction enzyme S subunit